MFRAEYLDSIQLTDKDYLAKGNHTLVYRHPTNEDYLLKILGMVRVLGLIKKIDVVKGLDHRFANSKWLGNGKFTRLFNRFYITKACMREFREVVRMRLCHEFLSQPPLFMQKVYGFVDTNIGYAMVVKAEKDRHGHYAPTLASLIKNNQVDSVVMEKLDALYQQLLAYDFVLSDINPGNLVYAYHEKHGEHFVLIDGIGDSALIPINLLSAYLRKRYKLRKIKQLKDYMAKVVISDEPPRY